VKLHRLFSYTVALTAVLLSSTLVARPMNAADNLWNVFYDIANVQCSSSGGAITFSYSYTGDYSVVPGMSFMYGYIMNGDSYSQFDDEHKTTAQEVYSTTANETFYGLSYPVSYFFYQEDYAPDGTLTSTSDYALYCGGDGAGSVVSVNYNKDATGSAATNDNVFRGPALPGKDARNLVLFLADTPVLNGEGGNPVVPSRVIRACQTAFIIGTSADGAFGRVFSMGGWVSLANTLDVPEDYGQPGSPVYPLCVGR
jgi:hypothetical protein